MFSVHVVGYSWSDWLKVPLSAESAQTSLMKMTAGSFQIQSVKRISTCRIRKRTHFQTCTSNFFSSFPFSIYFLSPESSLGDRLMVPQCYTMGIPWVLYLESLSNSSQLLHRTNIWDALVRISGWILTLITISLARPKNILLRLEMWLCVWATQGTIYIPWVAQ